MSKELTTEQKIMQATQYGLLIYAGWANLPGYDPLPRWAALHRR